MTEAEKVMAQSCDAEELLINFYATYTTFIIITLGKLKQLKLY